MLGTTLETLRIGHSGRITFSPTSIRIHRLRSVTAHAKLEIIGRAELVVVAGANRLVVPWVHGLGIMTAYPRLEIIGCVETALAGGNGMVISRSRNIAVGIRRTLPFGVPLLGRITLLSRTTGPFPRRSAFGWINALPLLGVKTFLVWIFHVGRHAWFQRKLYSRFLWCAILQLELLKSRWQQDLTVVRG